MYKTTKLLIQVTFVVYLSMFSAANRVGKLFVS